MSKTAFQQVLLQYEDMALSGGEVLDLVDGKAQIVLYPQLVNYSSIDQVLGGYGACVLLFEARPNYGHWCCLFRRGDLIEFFNPYGGFPDDSLEYIPLHYREESGQMIPYLSMLLMESPYKLSYNEYAFQKKADDVKTCGRHCAFRLIYRDLSLEDYHALMQDLKREMLTNADGVVTILTEGL